jgi:hypothetical protein
MSQTSRAANESSLSESDLAQTWFMKIQVELVKRFELKNLCQIRLVTIGADLRANACMLTQFNIYI